MKDIIHIESKEELTSYSLRSTHELVEVLGKSKRAFERILHESDDIFALITAEGRILSGNRTLAKLMGLEPELILDSNLQSLFASETWTIVRSHFSRIDTRHHNGVKFEIPIDGVDKNRLYQWSLSTFQAISDRRGEVYVVIAKDISALYDYERKLTNILSALPFGFLTINEQKKIEHPWSRYAEIILGTNNLANMDIESLFLECLIPSDGHELKEWMTTFLNQIGGEEENYQHVRHLFPSKLPIVVDGHRCQIKWLRMSYSPLVNNGKISKIFVIFEEIVDQVDSRKKLEQLGSDDDKMAQIILNIQEHDPKMLGNWCDEMELYFEHLHHLKLASGTAKAYSEVLISMEDVARALNFNDLENKICDLKSQIVNECISDEMSHSQSLWNEISKIKIEWIRLRACVIAVKKFKQNRVYIGK